MADTAYNDGGPGRKRLRLEAPSLQPSNHATLAPSAAVPHHVASTLAGTIGPRPPVQLGNFPRPLEPAQASVPAGVRMCMNWAQANSCVHGKNCYFAHGREELEKGIAIRFESERAVTPATATLDFSGNTRAGHVEKLFAVPQEQVSCVMTDATKDVVLELAGPSEIRWDKEKRRAVIVGGALQVDKATSLLQRVTTHCLWGASEAKVQALLKPRRDCTSARCRLSPMVPDLKRCATVLTPTKPTLTIGTDPSSGLVVKGANLSRAHATLEFIPEKGAVYIIDTSTNGTYLNGRRLPSKGSAKVVLWHGDEVLLQDPFTAGGSEFGYVVNLEII